MLTKRKNAFLFLFTAHLLLHNLFIYLLLVLLPHIVLICLTVQDSRRVCMSGDYSESGEQEQYEIGQQEYAYGQVEKHADRKFTYKQKIGDEHNYCQYNIRKIYLNGFK